MKFADINPYYTVKGRAAMAKKRKASKKTTRRRLPPRHKSGPKKGQFKKRR